MTQPDDLPPHAQEQGQDTSAQDWKPSARRLNEAFWNQLATIGVAGVVLVDQPNSGIVTRKQDASGLLSSAQDCADVANVGQTSRGPELQTSPRHAEAGTDMTVADPPEYLSTRQLAERLGVSYSSIRRTMGKPDFPRPTRITGGVRHEWHEVKAYLDRHRIGASPSEEARDGNGDGPGRGPTGGHRRT